MSITEADIKKLASLSRMKLTAEEEAQFAKEIDSILGYVDQINEVSGASAATAGVKAPAEIPHRNMLREDVADADLNPDSSVLVKSAPASEDGFVKVKKILN